MIEAAGDAGEECEPDAAPCSRAATRQGARLSDQARNLVSAFAVALILARLQGGHRRLDVVAPRAFDQLENHSLQRIDASR